MFNIDNLQKNAHIHFIGIGGISMSGIAQIMLDHGYTVSGSDRDDSNIVDKLRSLGANVYKGHEACNVEGADLIVYTAAIKPDNPEYARATELGIPMIDRAECLGQVMRKYTHAVGVAGTHGKTTTTSMLTHALVYADVDPTISVGGELDLIDGNIRIGGLDYFVTEACEYTNSFLKFYPSIAVITNVEEDHLDFFKDLDDIKNSFTAYAKLTEPNGYVIACGDDANVLDVVRGVNSNVITYGLNSELDYHPLNINYVGGYPEFDVESNGNVVCHIKLNVPGNHNIINALASIAVAQVLGIDANTAARGIETFKGTKRRFEKKGEINGASVIDDYAHHPTEIKATLTATRKMPHNKIRCIFQPHTYSRTRTLWNEFLEAFSEADELILTDIYAAREVFDGVTTSESLATAIKEKTGADVKYIGPFEEIGAYIKSVASDGDIIFTMGAGTVTQLDKYILK